MKVFYRPQMTARIHSFSPSAGKAEHVVADWLARRLIEPADIIGDFPAATVEQLCEVHDPEYVKGVLGLTIRNGFRNTDAGVAQALPHTTGSMIAAALHAARTGEVTCSPTSGFHHAHHAEGYGFCTFNGLIAAALAVKQSGLSKCIGIIDCDVHYGDGTQDIIDRLGLGRIKHWSMGGMFYTGRRVRASRFFSWLQDAIDDCEDCDLILYQAGADPHVRDPLGGVLSSKALAVRDAMVFDQLGGRVPIAWNLAGGYQTREGADTEAERLEPILAIHRVTARAAKGLL